MTTRRRIHVFQNLILFGLLSLNQTANAQINYLTTMRGVSVNASGFCDTPSNSDSTMSLGTYSANLSVNADTGGDFALCQADATGQADQMTDLQPWSIGGQGNSSSSAAFGGDSSGSSSLSVTFSVAHAYPYSLNGLVSGKFEEFFPDLSETPGGARVRLSDNSGIIHEAAQTTTADFPFSFAGTLSPGTYSLEANVDTSAFSDSRDRESFQFQFEVVPEPSGCLLVIFGLAGIIRASRS